jgi:hypothetical protein
VARGGVVPIDGISGFIHGLIPASAENDIKSSSVLSLLSSYYPSKPCLPGVFTSSNKLNVISWNQQNQVTTYIHIPADDQYPVCWFVCFMKMMDLCSSTRLQQQTLCRE